MTTSKKDTVEKPDLQVVGSTKPAIVTPDDAADFDSLWIDPKLGDGITTGKYHSIPVGKPRDFFRVHPDEAYRRRTELYVHKPEGMMDAQFYIIAPSMRGRIEEAKPCTLVTCIYRDGSPRLWPIMFPKEGEHDNEAWVSARSAAALAIERWVRLLWVRRSYTTRDALDGYAPDPDWDKVPLFKELVRLGFGEHGVIRDTDHPIYRELFGAPSKKAADQETASDDGDGDL